MRPLHSSLYLAQSLIVGHGEFVNCLLPSPCPFPDPSPCPGRGQARLARAGEGSIHAVAYLHSFRTGNCVSHLRNRCAQRASRASGAVQTLSLSGSELEASAAGGGAGNWTNTG